jgi:hypothetical protein
LDFLQPISGFCINNLISLPITQKTMKTLVFLLTFFTLLILSVIVITKAIKRKPIISTVKKMAFIIAGYLMIWIIFYLNSSYDIVPLGTDVCFDDWCATITQVENGPLVQKQFSMLVADSTYIVIHITMSNHARGIAQKPSEPRIHILDEKNTAWPYSIAGQGILEKVEGKQAPLDSRLELHQSIDTKLVFAVPASVKGLKVLIEEGPFITKLLFPASQEVFIVH